MYKIYINTTKVILLPSQNFDKTKNKGDEENLVAKYTGKTKHILNYVDMLEKSSRIKSLILHYGDFSKLKDDFKSLFKIVDAGGGAVINERNEILFIYRRKYWDLPKGKLEPTETRRKAAKREVIEETGINGVQLGKKLLVTNHTFKSKKGKRCIKRTHWYLMFGTNQNLTPQIEEDIEKTEWMSLEKFYSKERPVYNNILEVLNEVKTGKKL